MKRIHKKSSTHSHIGRVLVLLMAFGFLALRAVLAFNIGFSCFLSCLSGQWFAQCTGEVDELFTVIVVVAQPLPVLSPSTAKAMWSLKVLHPPRDSCHKICILMFALFTECCTKLDKLVIIF